MLNQTGLFKKISLSDAILLLEERQASQLAISSKKLAEILNEELEVLNRMNKYYWQGYKFTKQDFDVWKIEKDLRYRGTAIPTYQGEYKRHYLYFQENELTQDWVMKYRGVKYTKISLTAIPCLEPTIIKKLEKNALKQGISQVELLKNLLNSLDE